VKLAGRTILITGATSGIGFELAKQLVALGNTVVVTGRDPAKLAKFREMLPNAHALQSDVSDLSAIGMLYVTVTAQFPGLDTLINNAGIMRGLDLNAVRASEGLTDEIDINLKGPMRMVQQFLPYLKTRPNALIVNVSSALAYVPLPTSPVYSASKAALHAYTRALRVQLRNTPVKVVELLPPAVDTPLITQFAKEMSGQKTMRSIDLARKAIEGIEGGREEIRPGMSGLLMVLSRIAPHFALQQMVKAFQPKH